MRKHSVRKGLKSALALGLSAVLTMGLFTGCSSTGTGGTGGTSSSDDLITLTVFSERANYSGMQVGWAAKVLADNFGVELNIVPNTTKLLA